MIRDLILKNRTYRRFYQNVKIERATRTIRTTVTAILRLIFKPFSQTVYN
jgi:hypothetical protein